MAGPVIEREGERRAGRLARRDPQVRTNAALPIHIAKYWSGPVTSHATNECGAPAEGGEGKREVRRVAPWQVREPVDMGLPVAMARGERRCHDVEDRVANRDGVKWRPAHGRVNGRYLLKTCGLP